MNCSVIVSRTQIWSVQPPLLLNPACSFRRDCLMSFLMCCRSTPQKIIPGMASIVIPKGCPSWVASLRCLCSMGLEPSLLIPYWIVSLHPLDSFGGPAFNMSAVILSSLGVLCVPDDLHNFQQEDVSTPHHHLETNVFNDALLIWVRSV